MIRRVDAIPVSLPLRKPMHMAGMRIDRAENLLVRVEADNGLVGWGEASSAPTMTGDLRDGMVAAVRQHLAPCVLGQDALAHALLAQRCRAALRGNPGAHSALDMALLDLCGRHLHVPLHQLLGGPLRKTVRSMALLGNARADEDLAEAAALRHDGQNFFKLKVGVKPVEQEIEATRALRQLLGPDISLCADADMGFSMTDASRYLRGVADCGLLFLEQPLRHEDLYGMAALASGSATPLCLDESIGDMADILACHDAGAGAGMNLKTLTLGGPSACVRAVHLCEALGLAVNLACAVAESSIGAAALCHVGATTERLDWGLSVTHHYLEADLAHVPFAWHGGELPVPAGAGLGIDVDEAQVARFRAS
jgi:muconate cycloisomerase